jgi:hypothetical protein
LARHRAIVRGGAVRRALTVLVALVTTIGTLGAAGATAAPGAATTSAASIKYPSVLAAGQQIGSGSMLASPDRFVTLRMQRDGNLVLLAGGHVFWSAGTRGAGNFAQLDQSGRLAVYTPSKRVLWYLRTTGARAALRVGDDGSLTLLTASGHLLWGTNTRAVELDQSSYLQSGQFLTNRRGDRLLQQTNGDLVLRHANGALMWNARTYGHPGAFTLLQGDGNLVIYAANHQLLWKSGGTGPGVRLTIGPTGILALRRADGSLKWTSNPPAAAATPRTAAGYASALLKMWGGKVTGLPGAYSDLLATSRNQTIRSSDSCGQTVRVDVRIVAFLYQATSKYKIMINNIITGHGCDSGRHPRGMATDIGGAWNLATGAVTSFGGYWGPNNTAMDTQFATYAGSILPSGSGLGQRNCAGTSSAQLKSGIMFFPDSCNHQHVQV